jgi:hypothetical protein
MNPSNIIPTTSADASTAASNYQTAQGAANTSGQQDITLPQMLQSALTTSETGNNPTITQYGKDLSNYQAVTANSGADSSNETAPSMITSGPGGQTSPVPLPGDVQRMMVSNAQKNAASPLNADVMSLAMQNTGVLNTIKAIAASHAADTQKLADTANTAYNTWQTTLNSLNAKAQLAMSASNLAEQTREYNNSPVQLGMQTSKIASADARTYSSFQDLFAKYKNDPTLSAVGVSPQTLYAEWKAAHPNSSVDPALLQQIGISSGNPLQGAAAALGMNTGNLTTKIAPTGQGMGIGGLLGLIAGIPGGPVGMGVGMTAGAGIGGFIGAGSTGANGAPKFRKKESWY